MRKSFIDQLYKATAEALVYPDAEDTYKVVVTEANKLVDGVCGTVMLAKENRLYRAYSTVPKEYRINPRRYGYTFTVYSEHRAYILPAEQVQWQHPEITVKKPLTKYLLLIPLSYQKQSVGVLCIYTNKKFLLDDIEIKLLIFFASLVSLKINNLALMQNMRDSLESRDLFINMASHELKTPLTTMTLYSELLTGAIEKNLPIKPHWVKMITEQTARLKGLIEELLEIENIRSGELNFSFKANDLFNILKKAVTLSALSYPQTSFDFEFPKTKDNKLTLLADSDKLLQALVNILNNAAKFSPPEKVVKVTVIVKTNRVKIVISDQGPGIASKDIPHIFNKFYTGKKNGKSGMGLGLFITKTIVSGHNGKVWVQSKKGIGTTVNLRLPILR